MSRPRSDPASDLRVLRLLETAADAGTICPSNEAIMVELGAASVSAGSACLCRLEARGLIVVSRYHTARQVRIVATGKTTATPIDTSPHWRARATNTAKAARRYGGRKPALHIVGRSERIDDASLPPVVDRDPCPRCGTRRDIGCAHSAAPLSMGAFA